ncbi:MAG TPA: porin [Usitatibacter sp.]|nr:porin [Usitatibacter sp.]
MKARPGRSWMHKPKMAFLMAAILAACGAARADDDGPKLKLSGYGTLGVAHSDNRGADYLVDSFKPNGPGATRAWNTDTDSRLGLQASAELSPRVSAVLQVISQQRFDGSYRPTIEWANVRYSPLPDLSLRAGRIVLPVFMVTDSRRVGYANPWVRPPVELYSMIPITTSDGIDASYRMTLSPTTADTLEVTAGRSDAKFPPSQGLGTGTAEVRDILAVSNSLESGFLTVRLNYGQARLTIPEYAVFEEAFRQFGPPGAAIAERYGVHGKFSKFVGAGASYDPGPWFAMAEWAQFDTHTVIGKKAAWYVSAGHRWNKFTPYATFAQLKGLSNTSDPGIPLAGLPPPVAAGAAQLNAVLNGQLGILPTQSTLSLGVRWDLFRSAALKLQYDRVALGSGSRGVFGNIQPGFEPGSTVHLISATFDFVY